MIKDIYKVRSYDINPYVTNIRNANSELEKAKNKVEKAHNDFRKACAKLVKSDEKDLEFSNVCCMLGSYVSCHVYDKREKPYGICIFCGCDNGPDF